MSNEIDFILGVVTGFAVMGAMTVQNNMLATSACLLGGVFAAGTYVLRYLRKPQ